jgi:hypothetical protein
MKILSCVPLLAGVLFATASWADGPRPANPGDCVQTTIAAVGYRLEDASTGKPLPNSGSVSRFGNGIILISYDQVPAIDRSRKGDAVKLCLVSLPQNCPKGDDRGKIYKATNLRTNLSWTLPDSQHACGGA